MQGGPSPTSASGSSRCGWCPDEAGIQPGYEQHEIGYEQHEIGDEQHEIGDELLRGGLVTVASGMAEHADETAIRIKYRYAALYVSRVQAGGTITVSDAPFAHLFVARGNVELEQAGRLAEGSAVRLTGSGGRTLTAVDFAEVLSGRRTPPSADGRLHRRQRPALPPVVLVDPLP